MRTLLMTALCVLVLVRGIGVLAREIRDEMLRHMMVTSLQALEAAGVVAFLDWSSLLGVWREKSIIEDEEDADLGVILEEETGYSIKDAYDHVVDVIERAFEGQDYTVRLDAGMIYVVPDRSRLHLDLYLVRRPLSEEGGGTVLPVWYVSSTK